MLVPEQITALFVLPNEDLHSATLNRSLEMYKEHYECLYDVEEIVSKISGIVTVRLFIVYEYDDNSNDDDIVENSIENNTENRIIENNSQDEISDTELIISSCINLRIEEGKPNIEPLQNMKNKEGFNG